MKENYKVGIVKYTDHASLNRIELGAKRCLDELNEKYNINISYSDYVYDGKADISVMKEIADKLVEQKKDEK